MLIFSLSFLLGDVFLQLNSVLPSTLLITVSALAGSGAILFSRRSLLFFIMAAFMLGFSWAGWRANSLLQWQLPRAWEGKALVLNGTVASLPTFDKYGTRFIMDITSVENHRSKLKGHTNIRLNWPGSRELRVGDQYRLKVRLKRIHGTRNPGGFDYEGYAFQHSLRASGTVITKDVQRYLGHCNTCSLVNQMRQTLRKRILQYLPTSEFSPWLLALMLGDRSSVSPQHWQILRATGTNHLMAIAGLHIGLIAGLIHFLVQWFWRRNATLSERYPATLAGSVIALLIAWLYSALAGFSIPTQRACIMLTIFIAATLIRRQLPPWHAWSTALLAVLIYDPLSVLSESFWLSLGTIALIIYGMNGRLAPCGMWWKWGRVQWVIGVGLIPLSLSFFKEASVVSVLVNSIAIPWLGFLVLPFCLMSSFILFVWPPLGLMLLLLADKSLTGLWVMLTWFSTLDYAIWSHIMPSHWAFAFSLVGILLLLLPAGAPGKWLGLFWLLPIFFNQAQNILPGDFRMTTLDVGQGLSVVIQTTNHVLVFDAGPKFGDQFDMGESVVVPFLQVAGVRAVDKLIISHGDIDHLGGAAAVMRAMPVHSVLTSAIEKFPPGRANLCLAGMSWQWDGVVFRVLYPYRDALAIGNDSSCVLRINNGRHSALLTGDIERFAEKQLLSLPKYNLHADVMTAPHHGSKTSSQKLFIRSVAPLYTIFATGYRNRYHHPNAAIMRSYRRENVNMLNTAYAGAIQFDMKENESLIRPMQFRLSENHYWNDS